MPDLFCFVEYSSDNFTSSPKSFGGCFQFRDNSALIKQVTEVVERRGIPDKLGPAADAMWWIPITDDADLYDDYCHVTDVEFCREQGHRVVEREGDEFIENPVFCDPGWLSYKEFSNAVSFAFEETGKTDLICIGLLGAMTALYDDEGLDVRLVFWRGMWG